MKIKNKISAYIERKDIKLRLQCFWKNRKTDAKTIHSFLKKKWFSMCYELKLLKKKIKKKWFGIKFNINWAYHRKIEPFLLTAKANIFGTLADTFYKLADKCVDIEGKAIKKYHLLPKEKPVGIVAQPSS